MKIIYFIINLLLALQIFAQDTTMGLFYNSDNSYDGFTLLSNNENTYLIDNCGYQVNQWESNYKAGQGLYITEEGNLLRAGVISGDFNAGGRGGIFELYDWAGNRIWHYQIADNLFHAHHDMALLPNGNFLCLVWEKKTQQVAQSKGRKYIGEVWSESIWEIEISSNNQANVVWQWSVWDHLIQNHNPTADSYGTVSNHPELLDINYIGSGESTSGDWLHINGISYNESLDQIAISSRNLSEVYIIDHSTSTAESASHIGGMYGKGGDILYRYGNPQVFQNGNEDDQILFRPHNIDWVQDGTWKNHFSVFNNDYIPNTRSQALVWNNPAEENGQYQYTSGIGYGNEEILRSYSENGFYSSILSSVQVMPNDNLLMLEGKSGVITEVNTDNEVVWLYIYPVNKNGGPGIQSGTPLFNSLFRAIRYPRDFIGFEGKDLSPTVPIELSPNNYICDTNIISSATIIKNNDPYIVHGNPTSDRLWIESFTNSETSGYLIDLMGRVTKEFSIQIGLHSYSIGTLRKGTYILLLNSESMLLVIE